MSSTPMSDQLAGGAGSDPATDPKRPEASLGELVAEMTSDLSSLFRKEIDLAKTEARDELTQAGKAGMMFAAAALAGWLALLLVSLAVAWLLDEVMHIAVALAIVAALWAVAAFILQRTGRVALTRVRGLPTTRDTLKEDLEWAKAQKS